MVDARYPRDVHRIETRPSNPFMLATVENEQGTVDANELRVERKCELCNPFRDERCGSSLLSLPQQIPFAEPIVRVMSPPGHQVPTHPYPLFLMCL